MTRRIRHVFQACSMLLVVAATATASSFAQQPAAPDIAAMIAAGDHARAEAEILALLRSGAFGPAEAHLRRLVERQPAVARYRYFHGFALLRLYRLAEAEQELRVAVGAAPDEDAWLEALANVLVDEGRSGQALGFLDRALAIRPLPQYHAARAACLINLGRIAEAEAALRTCLAGKPGDGAASSMLGNLLQNAGRDGDSLVHLENAVTADAANIEARYRLALARLKAGSVEPAARGFEAVLAVVPSHVGALYNLARVRGRQGRKADADSLLARFQEASLLEDRIQFQRAGIKLAPQDIGRKLELADLLLQAGRNAEALAELQAVIQASGGDARSLRLLATALRRLGHVEEAASAESAARAAGGR